MSAEYETERAKEESATALAELEGRLDDLEARVDELERQKRLRAIDLDIEIEQMRGIHPPPETPHE